MPKLPRISSRVLLKALHKAGFIEHHQHGSHITLKEPDTNKKIVVVDGRKDYPPGLLKSTLNSAGLTVEDLISLLDLK